jgi:hypothetical protein
MLPSTPVNRRVAGSNPARGANFKWLIFQGLVIVIRRVGVGRRSYSAVDVSSAANRDRGNSPGTTQLDSPASNPKKLALGTDVKVTNLKTLKDYRRENHRPRIKTG